MRADLDIIQQWIKPGSHVLDLGCGDGTLLDFLQNQRQATGFGLEINMDHITSCMAKGVAVIEQNLDTQGLSNFADDSFDVVLMTQATDVPRADAGIGDPAPQMVRHTKYPFVHVQGF